jgi:hypothetical protein
MYPAYAHIAAFMAEYFPTFSEYGQDPATVDVMHDFFVPDLQFFGYMGSSTGPLTFSNRDAFLAYDVSHPWAYERLTPLDMTIDERRKMVFAIIAFEFVERASERVLVKSLGAAQYHLTLDEKSTIKIKRILYFPQRQPPGALSGGDVLGRPPAGWGEREG